MESNSKAQPASPAGATPVAAPSNPSMGQGRGTDLRPAHSGATVAPEARPTYAGKADGACDKTMKNAADATCDASAKTGAIGLADDAGAPLGGKQDDAAGPTVTVPAKAGNVAVAST